MAHVSPWVEARVADLTSTTWLAGARNEVSMLAVQHLVIRGDCLRVVSLLEVQVALLLE